jgi:hypothetical protein
MESLDPALRPLKVVRICVEDLLSEVMNPGSLSWEYGGMPTLNPVCSELSPLVAAKAYLRQRDDGALAASRSLASRYYPVNYWSQSFLCLIQPVLNRLGSSRYSVLRASYLNLVWDAVLTGRKKGSISSGRQTSAPSAALRQS